MKSGKGCLEVIQNGAKTPTSRYFLGNHGTSCGYYFSRLNANGHRFLKQIYANLAYILSMGKHVNIDIQLETPRTGCCEKSF